MSSTPDEPDDSDAEPPLEPHGEAPLEPDGPDAEPLEPEPGGPDSEPLEPAAAPPRADAAPFQRQPAPPGADAVGSVAPRGDPPQRSFGGGLAAGVGIGCGAFVAGALVILATLGMVASTVGFFWPFILIAIIAIVMMFFRRTRPIATGMLIVTAAMWIIVIGPCLALISQA